MSSLININGEVRDTAGLDLPDRQFRGAWKFNGAVVELDADLLKPIMRNLVNEERERRKHLPVAAAISGDVVEAFADGSDDVTHTGGLVINMDMRNDNDRVNLLGLTVTGSLLVSQASPELKKVYTADDKIYKLTGAQLLELGVQAGAHDGYVYDKARTIKAMDPIPADYATNETYWT
tara:strand:- start:29 stop:562 length:534 start_codon:yes stop_codon:yes gene_type:complete